MMPRYDALPPSLAPRGLCWAAAAQYVGVGLTKFRAMVADERMPKPKRIDNRDIFDRLELDAAFDALPAEDTPNPWDTAA